MQAPLVFAFGLALIAGFLVSRVLLWLLRRWDGGISKLALVHVATVVLLTVVYGLASANGGPIPWAFALLFLPPQFLLLIVDVIRGVGDVDPEDYPSDPPA